MEKLLHALEERDQLWDLFTRREEYDPPFLDGHSRFLYFMSKHRNVLEPEVSRFLFENGLRVEYPEGRRFAVCLTHDIDTVGFPKLSTLSQATRSVASGHVIEGVKNAFSGLNKEWSPIWNFGNIMSLEQKYGAESSFYFLATSKGYKGFTYEVESMEEVIAEIADRGWEIGLHGGYDSYINLDRIEEEKGRLERVMGRGVIGYRNHYLRFKVPDTWELLSKAGIKYDTTFGYADCAGFRNGMCHPFRPVNLTERRQINIVEIPLTIMDETLFDNMALGMEGAWEMIKLIVNRTEKYNGVVTVLWHNTHAVGDKLKLYEKTLRYCKDRSAWMTSGRRIYEWWIRGGYA